jgi:hypothetical protein
VLRKQLYLIYDTRKGATNEVLISHIQALRHSFNSLKAQYPIPPGQHIPTNKANMFSSLFPIHHIANTDFPNFKHLSDGCVICIEQFAETTGQIMLNSIVVTYFISSASVQPGTMIPPPTYTEPNAQPVAPQAPNGTSIPLPVSPPSASMSGITSYTSRPSTPTLSPTIIKSMNKHSSRTPTCSALNTPGNRKIQRRMGRIC